ncbi:MAG: hypothetical protein H0W86_07865 [Armatimonadetes bacterium]|nr:hypothetical protein [Armatimonadota bacterium]
MIEAEEGIDEAGIGGADAGAEVLETHGEFAGEVFGHAGRSRIVDDEREGAAFETLQDEVGKLLGGVVSLFLGELQQAFIEVAQQLDQFLDRNAARRNLRTDEFDLQGEASFLAGIAREDKLVRINFSRR